MAPRWRQLFDTWEKAVAPGLEDLTASTEFRQAIGSATKLNAAMARQVEAASRQWLHAMNLPTASDVRKLRRQIASLEDEVSALRRAVRTTPAGTSTGSPTGSPTGTPIGTGGGPATANGSDNGSAAGKSSRSTATKSAKKKRQSAAK